MENAIASLPYYKVEREVDKLSICTKVHELEMHLYMTCVRTAHKEIPIDHLFDISYRRMRGEEGLLYLHTNQGIVTLTLKVDPSGFIEAYQGIVGK
ncbi:hypothetical protein PA598K_06427 [Paenibacillus sp. 598K]|uniref:hypothetical protein n=1 Tax=Paenibacillus sp. 598K TaxID=1117987 RepID=UPI000FF99EB2|nr:hypothetical protein [Paenibacillus sp. 598K]GBF77851.1 hypothetical protein PA598K_06427 [Paenibacillus sp. 598K]